MKITINIGDEEHEVPARFEVCPCCHGHGSTDHPAFSNGVDMSEWDEDDRDSYYDGAYDVTCQECNGRGLVAVPCEDLMDPELVEQMHEDAREIAHMNAIYTSERRMGA